MSTQLKNPPLIEALLEIKWNLRKLEGPDTYTDPGFKIASGRLYDRINKRFPVITNLPAAAIPEEISAYTVRHQFRTEPNGWPLVQIGPGVATVNYTTPYSWKKFKDTIRAFVPQLVASYSGVISDQQPPVLQANSVLLRYINAVEWDWEESNALQYLLSNLHTTFQLPQELFDPGLTGLPVDINLQVGYPITEPKGKMLLRFGTGRVGQTNGLIWELIFVSVNDEAPSLTETDSFLSWVSTAHDIIEKWFFVLIKGELYRTFKGV